MTIDYDHSRNRHTVEGAATAFSLLLSSLPHRPQSLVDVGCGTGVWLKAAIDNGVKDVLGVDAIALNQTELVVPCSLVITHDLTQPLTISRRFDMALCLEVAEHLDADHAHTLVDSLVELADTVVFSAACPGQPGQHHVNCQWPAYWQAIFNSRGYRCDDAVRWTNWEVSTIEPWYRQNMFIASRDPGYAGKEDRIPAVRHPEIFGDPSELLSNQMRWIAAGGLPMTWYFRVALSANATKMIRFFRRVFARLPCTADW